jgi:hypothetical protein
MKNKLKKMANYFYNKGQLDKSIYLDRLIIRAEEADLDPTDEELRETERWLQEEGIDPSTLTEEEALSGLEGEDLEVAERYMGGEGVEDIRNTLNDLKEQQDLDVERELGQQKIMNELSEMFMSGRNNPRAMPFQSLMPEASLLEKMVKLSNRLDKLGMHDRADYVDEMVTKLATNGWDDEFFGSDDSEEEELYGDMDEPDTEELLDEQMSFAEKYWNAIEFIKEVAEGKHLHADVSAKHFLQTLDEGLGTYEDTRPPSKIENQPSNVVQLFPER